MKRRKFLLGVGSTAAAGSALLGSGAFSQVDAQRSVTISVAEDPNAYLGLDKCQIDGSETPNSSYAHLDDLGHLKVYMDDENPTIGETPLGQGINSDSTSIFHRVFQICNQGKEDVCVHIADSESWPRVPEGEPDAGERRVDFYLEANEGASVVGEENAFQLPLGECVCIGIKTRSYGLSEGDELLANLDNEIEIVADVDGNCAATCPQLTAQYRCTTYEQENPGDDYQRIGTRVAITNTGDIGVSYDLAINDSPGSYRENIGPIDPNTTEERVADASVPVDGLVIWEPPEGCDVDPAAVNSVRWADFKAGDNSDGATYADLTDWYASLGSGDDPADAPQDLDDDALVAEVTNIPDQDQPDESISPNTFPDMSSAAEDAGWITCRKPNGNGS